MGNFEERFLSDKIFIRQAFYQIRFLSDKIPIREDGCLSDFSFADAADLDSPTEHLPASSWRATKRRQHQYPKVYSIPIQLPFHRNFLHGIHVVGGNGDVVGGIWLIDQSYQPFLDQVVFAFGPRLAFNLTQNQTKNKNHNQLAYK